MRCQAYQGTTNPLGAPLGPFLRESPPQARGSLADARKQKCRAAGEAHLESRQGVPPAGMPPGFGEN